MASRSQPSDELSIFGVFAGENPIYAGPLGFPDHQPDAYRPSSAFQPDASAVTLPLSDNVEAPITAPVTDPTDYATKEAWTHHQADIKQLYFHEKKPLSKVMRLMEDKHGFRATVKMYKTHIKQWGLDKKIKEPEMRAVVRKYKQRENQGKSSIIRIRDQVRDFGDFIRYCHRKGISIDDIVARQTSSPTPEAVALSTPVPSPITTPQVLAIPERIFRCIRDYFKGSFESGTWVSTEPAVLCHSIKVGGGIHDPMIELFDFHALILSRSDLNVAIAKLNNVFSAEPPATLDVLFSLMIDLHRQMTEGLSSVLFRLFSAVGKMLLGSEHPLTRVCQWSGSVDASEFEAIATRCMETMADQLQSSVGPMHQSTLSARRNLIRVGTYRREARIQMLQELLGECEKTLRPHDARIRDIRADIVVEYLSVGDYAEAMPLMQQNLAFSQDPSSTSLRLLYDPDYMLYIVARCEYAHGEVDSGIAVLLKAISSRMLMWGPQDSRARDWLLLLEDWYDEKGLCDDDAEIREIIQVLVQLIDTD